MAKRFIVKLEDLVKIDEDVFKMKGSEVKHIHVLRHEVDDDIVVNNMNAKIVKITKDEIVIKKLGDHKKTGEPEIEITFFQAFLKSEKMDLVIQKLVELGVKNITGFFSKNVVVKLDEKERLKRQSKLQKIADEACKQCGRTDNANVTEFVDFKVLLKSLSEYDLIIFAYENEDFKNSRNLKEIIAENRLKNIKKIGVIVGGEGGFSADEAESLKNINSVKTVSLGERILRAETCSIYLASILNYEFDI